MAARGGGVPLRPNWVDDRALCEEQRKAKAAKEASGSLLCQSIQRKAAHHRTPAATTPAHPDGFTHFGDRVVVQCLGHSGALSVDLDDGYHVAGHPRKVLVTCAPAPRAVRRNIWVLVRVPGPDDDEYPAEEAEVLHYEQPFRLELTPDLCGDEPLALHSEPLSGATYSKVSRSQEVTAADRGASALVWRASPTDPQARLEAEGRPVPTGAALLLTHSQTNGPLCSLEQHRYLNDFGPEWEVCCQAARRTEAKGPRIPQQPANHWRFLRL